MNFDSGNHKPSFNQDEKEKTVGEEVGGVLHP